MKASKLLKFRRTTGLLLSHLFGLLLLTLSGYAQSAEFFYEPSSKENGSESISIRGEINEGDFERFKEFLLRGRNLKAFTNRVWLNSPGGNVAESIKFSDLFEKISASVIVGPESKCYSACFIIFAGGVDRTLAPFGELGVHRISLANLQTDLKKGKSLVLPMAKDVYGYLLDRGIPRAILDKMMETPATDIFIIDFPMLMRSGWYRAMSEQPIFFDTVEKACGRFPDPYPERSELEQPRDESTRQKMNKWADCKIGIKISNTQSFLDAEYQLLKQGKISLLFPKGMTESARRALLVPAH
jgi:hypothetical protein